jgi:NAD(P)-dependent dehydrogenase (short-subunit alcohol dehydrogenase family)
MNSDVMKSRRVDSFVQASVPNVPLGCAGTAEQIDKAALFPTSDESSYETGTELFVDGGLAQV